MGVVQESVRVLVGFLVDVLGLSEELFESALTAFNPGQIDFLNLILYPQFFRHHKWSQSAKSSLLFTSAPRAVVRQTRAWMAQCIAALILIIRYYIRSECHGLSSIRQSNLFTLILCSH